MYLNGTTGGVFLSGFLAGFAGTMLSPVAGSARGYYAKIAANAFVAGTVSQITGGKFANGAWSGAFRFMFNEWLHDLANFSAGFGDSVTFGATSKLRQWLDWDENVEYESGYYSLGDDVGDYTSMTLGGGRLAYAGLAKGASLMSGLTARQTFNFRNTLKKVFRLNMSSTFRVYSWEKMLHTSKYASKFPNMSDRLMAIKAASGRTNNYLNTAGGVVFYNGYKD